MPNLTLIDLPGIVYTNDSIKNKIQTIYNKFISPKSTIILNVLSAENDFKTNESIMISDKIDPLKDRTIYVITKIDRCQEEGFKEAIE